MSGVVDPAILVDEMRDPHRGLVDAADRLGTIAQIRALRAGGYIGPVSFEAFAPAVQALADPGPALRASIDHVFAEAA
jgi:2-keto-myo-inositol isomerase